MACGKPPTPPMRWSRPCWCRTKRSNEPPGAIGAPIGAAGIGCVAWVCQADDMGAAWQTQATQPMPAAPMGAPMAPGGSFERFVLHQHGLDQRIGGVGGLPQAIPDQAFGLGIALGVLQRGQAVEQFDDEIAFLWGHCRLLPP